MRKLHDGLAAATYNGVQSVPGHAGIPSLSFAPNPQPVASPTHAELVVVLLDIETDGEAGQADASAAAERVWQKLSDPLASLVSPAGVRAILSRALHVARAEHALLAGVRADSGSAIVFEGVAARDGDATAVRQALLGLLTILLDLLTGFIGDNLTLRLVQEAWPDLQTREREPAARTPTAGRLDDRSATG